MMPYMVEVNVRTVDTQGAPVPRTKLQFRLWDGHDFKSITTNANGRGKLLLLPCNSFQVQWTQSGTVYKSRVHVQYDIRREGTPYNHKKIDVTLVVAAGGPTNYIWFTMCPVSQA